MRYLSKRFNIDSVQISLASSADIQKWSERTLANGKVVGEVTKSDTVHYRTLKPIPDGLFCERIFGPVKDYVCSCGKRYTKKLKENYCLECEVEFTRSEIRRYRLGYIKLNTLVTHVWFIKSRYNTIADFLGLERKIVEIIIYCTAVFRDFEFRPMDVNKKPSLPQSLPTFLKFKNLLNPNYLETATFFNKASSTSLSGKDLLLTKKSNFLVGETTRLVQQQNNLLHSINSFPDIVNQKESLLFLKSLFLNWFIGMNFIHFWFFEIQKSIPENNFFKDSNFKIRKKLLRFVRQVLISASLELDNFQFSFRNISSFFIVELIKCWFFLLTTSKFTFPSVKNKVNNYVICITFSFTRKLLINYLFEKKIHNNNTIFANRLAKNSNKKSLLNFYFKRAMLGFLLYYEKSFISIFTVQKTTNNSQLFYTSEQNFTLIPFFFPKFDRQAKIFKDYKVLIRKSLFSFLLCSGKNKCIFLLFNKKLKQKREKKKSFVFNSQNQLWNQNIAIFNKIRKKKNKNFVLKFKNSAVMKESLFLRDKMFFFKENLKNTTGFKKLLPKENIFVSRDNFSKIQNKNQTTKVLNCVNKIFFNYNSQLFKKNRRKVIVNFIIASTTDFFPTNLKTKTTLQCIKYSKNKFNYSKTYSSPFLKKNKRTNFLFSIILPIIDIKYLTKIKTVKPLVFNSLTLFQERNNEIKYFPEMANKNTNQKQKRKVFGWSKPIFSTFRRQGLSGEWKIKFFKMWLNFFYMVFLKWFKTFESNLLGKKTKLNVVPLLLPELFFYSSYSFLKPKLYFYTSAKKYFLKELFVNTPFRSTIPELASNMLFSKVSRKKVVYLKSLVKINDMGFVETKVLPFTNKKSSRSFIGEKEKNKQNFQPISIRLNPNKKFSAFMFDEKYQQLSSYGFGKLTRKKQRYFWVNNKSLSASIQNQVSSSLNKKILPEFSYKLSKSLFHKTKNLRFLIFLYWILFCYCPKFFLFSKTNQVNQEKFFKKQQFFQVPLAFAPKFQLLETFGLLKNFEKKQTFANFLMIGKSLQKGPFLFSREKHLASFWEMFPQENKDLKNKMELKVFNKTKTIPEIFREENLTKFESKPLFKQNRILGNTGPQALLQEVIRFQKEECNALLWLERLKNSQYNLKNIDLTKSMNKRERSKMRKRISKHVKLRRQVDLIVRYDNFRQQNFLRSQVNDNSLIKIKQSDFSNSETFITNDFYVNRMFLSILPVLPPTLRPIVPLEGGQVAIADLNRLYQRVLYRNQCFGDSSFTARDPKDQYFAQRLLQEAIDALMENGKAGSTPVCGSNGRPLKSLSEILKGKKGRFRQNLLGKRVDYSGRSVIVVGPKLKIHECGLPQEMAIELFQPFLVQRLLKTKLVSTIMDAKRFISKQPPIIWKILRQLMASHPVLLNRAPTLHRLGIQAFLPKLVTGRAILLHPLVCTAFNADFDGDQMAVHVPLSSEARAEAWTLMWSRHQILSPATGQPLLVPSQDMVLGCYYLTTATKQLPSETKIFSSTDKEKIGFLPVHISSQRKGRLFNEFTDVIRAYSQNQVGLHVPVWVRSKILMETSFESEQLIELRIGGFGQFEQIFSNFSRSHSINSKKTYDITTLIRTTPGRVFIHEALIQSLKANSNLVSDKNLQK